MTVVDDGDNPATLNFLEIAPFPPSGFDKTVTVDVDVEVYFTDGHYAWNYMEVKIKKSIDCDMSGFNFSGEVDLFLDDTQAPTDIVRTIGPPTSSS